MEKVVISKIVAQNSFGSIVACRDISDKLVNVIMPRDIWPAVGEAYEVDGVREEYLNRFGKVVPQMKATVVVRTQTSGCLIRPWLEQLPGIGPTRSCRLLEAFGNDIIAYLSDSSMTSQIGYVLEPQRPEAGERLAALVQLHYLAHQARENVAVAEGDFLLKLEQYGVTDRQAAKKMFRLIGSVEAFDQLETQPYLAAGLLPWKQVDHLGLHLLKKTRDTNKPNLEPERLAGACDNVWRDLLQDGHTAVSRDAFLSELNKRKVNPAKALRVGIERRRVIESGDFLRPPGAKYLETTLAQRMVALERCSTAGVDLPDDFEKMVQCHENPSRPLTDEQRRAVCGMLRSRFCILQGGAGTGKTTTLKVLVDTWVSYGGNVLLGALSGKAALRMSRSTGRLAQTLARHLLQLERSAQATEMSGGDWFPELTSKTMFIIDEASMVDLVTMRKVAFAVPDGAKIVLVGDQGQLPPIGLGQVFHDLIEMGHNVIHLTQVHRQSDDNPIMAAATAVREGRLPILPLYIDNHPGIFHKDVSTEHITGSIMDILDQMLPSIPLENILVLCGLRRSCAGVNRAMQVHRQLAGHEGIRIGPFATWVSVGDPVICTRNRYEDALMNGMIGHVNSLDPFTVRWDGDEFGKKIPQQAYLDIASAWAITCHRAQGSEARHVIVALDGTVMLTREWLYTAITRATDQVILVGPLDQIEATLHRRSKRTTYFAQEVDFWRSK